jgi:hypothetical protein
MGTSTYKIAEETGHVGHDVNAIKAEINLGLKKGYGGFAQEKGDVLNFLTGLYVEAGAAGQNFVPFVVTDSVITYAYPTDKGWHGEHEPALVLSSVKSPLYAADETDDEWKTLVEEYAAKLGAQFQQWRVYVSYSRVEIKIFQQA